MRLPQFIFDAWDEVARAEAYAQFVAGQDTGSVVSDSAETHATDNDLTANSFAAGFKRGCAWRQARIQASQPSQRAAPAAGVTIGRENGNALAGQ